MNIELVLVALVVVVLNVLDSVTTLIAFRQYPDKKLEGEGNPMMRWLMLKSRILSEVVKQGGVLAILVWMIAEKSLHSLRLASLLLGLVVLNNSFVIVSRAIAKRRVTTPFERLRMLLRVPKKFSYLLIIITTLSLAIAIDKLVWG